MNLVAWAMRLPRTLRGVRSPLSLYILSTMEAPPPGLRSREGDPLPAPPRAWTCAPPPRSPRCRRKWALRCAAHVWANCIIAALSFQAMGGPCSAPPHARAGAPASAAQLALWDNVHARVAVFLRSTGEVDGGPKVADAQSEVATIERLVAKELGEAAGYRTFRPPAYSSKDDWGLVPLAAADVALPARGGFFDLAKYLPDVDERAAYDDPDTLLSGGDASGEPPTRSAPRALQLPTSELLKLCQRLDSAGILALVPADEATDHAFPAAGI